MLEKIVNSKSRTFISLCFCFLSGILLMSLIDTKFSFVYFYLSLFISISFIIIFWKNKKVRFVLLCLSILVLGVFRYWLALPGNEVKEGRIQITGYVASEPDVRTDGVRYIVETHGNASVQGKIYFKSPLYPRYQYGDVLRLNCDLERPEPIDDFRYDKYLAVRGVFAICNNPQAEKSVEGEGNFFMRGILFLKNKVAERVSALWHEPYAGFMAGLLYGYRGGLGGLNDLFAKTGISHIIAISGYNISIIASVLVTVFVYLLIPRKKAFWLVSGGIVLFVIFTGASPSVMRAGIMGGLALLAGQIGRVSRAGNVLTLAAVLMVLQNPFVLVWDAGFQLSFAATLGLVYLTPFTRVCWEKLKAEIFSLRNSSPAARQTVLASKISAFNFFNESLISTLSAILATLPLILHQFGRLSVVALPVNILVLWTIPFLMLGGFLAVVFSFLFFPLGQVIAWLTFVGMKYVVVIVEFFGKLKWAAVDLSLPWWGMVAMYAGMIYLVVKMKYKQNTNKI